MALIKPSLSVLSLRSLEACVRKGETLPAHRVIKSYLSRNYATQSSLGGSSKLKPSRRQVTVTTDDGRYDWSELSTSEKAARGTQQTFNFSLVALGAAGVVLVSYFLYQELIAPDSKTRQFNKAVDRVKSNARCIELLGDARSIKAYGEPTASKWARARPLAATTSVDQRGIEHFRMHFNVEGPDNSGIVAMYMTKCPTQSELQYQSLTLTVKGHPTVVLEDASTQPQKKPLTLWGFNFGG